jgi:hypothetical protein
MKTAHQGVNDYRGRGKRYALILDPVAVQIIAVGVEPGLGAVDMAADLAHDAPEPRRVVHLDEMRHFMGGEIVQHVGRREDQPPGNDSTPAVVHEPQRLDWSRIDTRLTRTPSACA